MKIVKPMTLSLMHRPYRWQGRDRLLVATLGFFALGGRPEALLRDNLQWRKVMSALPPGRPLDELMPKTRGEVLLAGSAYAAMNLGDFESCIDFRFNADKMLVALKIVDTFAKRSIAHEGILTTEGAEENDER